ncbi:endo alpha-1,4 polygalactosaminidase [Burkholderia sp. MR1-5-21]
MNRKLAFAKVQSVAVLFGAALALGLASHPAAGAGWPPILDPNPAVQPPKWDWQLASPITINPDTTIRIYDIDMFNNEQSGAVQALHGNGYKVICYVDVGSWENWRDDAGQFPASILGATYSGFPDEQWLDVRDVNPAKSQTGMALATILGARFDRAKNMGCDAIEPDNIDGYDTTAHESSGFPLTYDDQLYFNLWVAGEAQKRGMLVGLKNDINQAQDSQIVNAFDFVVSEQCFEYGECGFFSSFLALNKPVFEAEYDLDLTQFCPDAKASRISAIKKNNSLDAVRQDCSAYYH